MEIMKERLVMIIAALLHDFQPKKLALVSECISQRFPKK